MYNATGEIIFQSGSMADDFTHRFSTKQFDKETGLSYYIHRYYDPILNCWLSRDPIGERGGVNLYQAMYNNAINVWDYLGLDPKKMYLIVGPNIQNTSEANAPLPIVEYSQIKAIQQKANEFFKKQTGKSCAGKVKLLYTTSSIQDPMNKDKFVKKLGLTKGADVIMLLFHGEETPTGTGIILFDNWSDRSTGQARGKVHKLNDLIDTSTVAGSVNDLFVSCCYNSKLEKKVGGKKIIPVFPTKGKNSTMLALPAFRILYLDLCCKAVQEEGSFSDKVDRAKNKCCPALKGK